MEVRNKKRRRAAAVQDAGAQLSALPVGRAVLCPPPTANDRIQIPERAHQVSTLPLVGNSPRRARSVAPYRAGFAKAAGHFALAAVVSATFLARVSAAETNSLAQPKFLGSQSCSSSSCHGGAGEKSDQYTIWSTHDFHHARPYATLETARSERLAEVLKIGNAAESPRCTVCHAPFQTVPAERRGPDVHITEGVSCETCHGPAENWLRSHTRPDYTHADRLAAGMHDMKNLYVRANTCVACHQNIDPEIRAAGHPELIFEMDGQSATMPRHWPKTDDKPGPQAWLVGQAVAFREARWQLSQNKSSSSDSGRDELIARENALFWLLQRVSSADPSFPTPALLNTKSTSRTVQGWADDFARAASSAQWTDDLSKKCLGLLTEAREEMPVQPQLQQARRAERIVLALDRLTLGLSNAATNSAVNASLNKLFADAQSPPDFDPQQFAKDLNTFHSSVAGFLETK